MPIQRRRGLAALALTALFIHGCASNPKPVLYPNEHYKTVGQEVADQDIEDCMEWAEEQVEKYRTGENAAKAGGKGAVVGAAAGGVGSAVGGGSVGRGVGIGAAMGATAGVVGSLFDSSEPDPIYKQFVNECLIEKGYRPAGWK